MEGGSWGVEESSRQGMQGAMEKVMKEVASKARVATVVVETVKVEEVVHLAVTSAACLVVATVVGGRVAAVTAEAMVVGMVVGMVEVQEAETAAAMEVR